jgi:hypothetical protein
VSNLEQDTIGSTARVAAVVGTDSPALRLLDELLPVILSCGVMACAVLISKAAAPMLAPALPAPLTLLIYGTIGAATYGATLWLFYRPMLRETWAMLRQRDASDVAVIDPA